MVVLDGDELPISICLTQHRLAHQLGSSLLLQEGRVADPPVQKELRVCNSILHS